MSNHHIDWLSRLVLPPSKKLVLLCLADSADRQTGIAIPGFENILAWSCLSRSQASAVVAELVTDGLVDHVSKGTRGHRAEFRVHCPCPDHRNNGSGVPDPIEAKGSGPQDPIGEKGSGKGPERVRELPDPSPTPKSSSTPTAARGTRLPADWSPDPGLVDYAVAQGFTRSQVDRIGLDFRDYWTAKPGQGGIKLDWAATWRMWVRNEAERKGVKPRTQAAPTQAVRDPQAARQAADAAARKRQEDQRAAWRADQARQMALLAEMDAQ